MDNHNWQGKCARRGRRREKLGLSVETVAEAVGVSRPTLWRWENGKRRPHRLMEERWEQVLTAMEVLRAS